MRNEDKKVRKKEENLPHIKYNLMLHSNAVYDSARKFEYYFIN